MSLTQGMLPPQAGKGTTHRKGKEAAAVDSIPIESLPLNCMRYPFQPT